MPRILVDANVILDIFQNDPHWFEWSKQTLSHHTKTHQLCINPIIYTEISVSFHEQSTLDKILAAMAITSLPLPKPALFLAGKAFKSYRANTGTKRSPLPDFFIGAHAQIEQLPLITRDIKRYQTYFPKVQLITPNTH